MGRKLYDSVDGVARRALRHGSSGGSVGAVVGGGSVVVGGSVVLGGGGGDVGGGLVTGGFVTGGLVAGGEVTVGDVTGEVGVGDVGDGQPGRTGRVGDVVMRRIVVVGPVDGALGPLVAGSVTAGTVVSVATTVVTPAASGATVEVVGESTSTTRAAPGDCGGPSETISVAIAGVDALIPTIIPANTKPLSAPMMRRCERAGWSRR